MAAMFAPPRQLWVVWLLMVASEAWLSTVQPPITRSRSLALISPRTTTHRTIVLQSSSTEDETTVSPPDLPCDYQVPEDAVITIKPAAMRRLRELRDQRASHDEPMILRMGVRSGGCSGMSYVMDFSTANDIAEDDAVDVYQGENIQCVVDAKSMLYLYGLELDYSDKLIGGGFQFYNPNAEESCGCGSSFGV